MIPSLVDKIANAVLYEGYILYPYRASSRKNQERFTFGRVYPHAYSLAQNGTEPFAMQTECLLRGHDEVPDLKVRVRFLHLMARMIGLLSAPAAELPHNISPDCFSLVPELRVDDRLFQSWQEAVEREFVSAHERIDSLVNNTFSLPLHCTDSLAFEPIHNSAAQVLGAIIRRQQKLSGKMEISAQPVDKEVFKITVRVENHTQATDTELDQKNELLMRTFASAHTILESDRGEFLSMTDPPEAYASVVASCSNVGTWPVLVGEKKRGRPNSVLASPIILYDYPEIAPESPCDFFDGTEIDEMLALRVLTMTDQEKWEMSQVDERARQILNRSESLPEEAFWSMHGTIRDGNFSTEEFFDPNTRLDRVTVDQTDLKVGHRVP